ncbi:MAG TPA: fluoride efflux transporter CrcB [Gemmatimonadaceae bacterium]|nr:fluoride efflux transporter CrcB [Gemmatimonadaceae bacterium]
MLNYLYVALGSAAGGVARWSVGNWVQRLGGGLPPAVFPVGTLVVNATGSFVLGLLSAWLTRPGAAGRTDIMWLLLGVGFCGGYTTFSTFSLDTVALLETRGGIAAAVNVVASVSAGLIGVVSGMLLGRAAMARFA